MRRAGPENRDYAFGGADRRAGSAGEYALIVTALAVAMLALIIALDGRIDRPAARDGAAGGLGGIAAEAPAG